MGMMRKMPGPLGGRISLPSRKITPRSYSRQIFTAEAKMIKAKMMTTIAGVKIMLSPPF
jgi:hypothetical protein